MNKNGHPNTRKYTNTLDDSMDIPKLLDVYCKTYRRNDMITTRRNKMYTNHVINVTFKYAVTDWNRCGKNTYIKYGYAEGDAEWKDSLAWKNGELIGVRTDTPIEKAADSETLAPYFAAVLDTYKPENGKKFEALQYKRVKNFKTMLSTAETRERLYQNGFDCDGMHFVRWKRSAGSSRVGKCQFIDEAMYSRIHRWELCGLRYREGDQVDLASLESYIALTSSAIIGTLEIKPENILLVDDYNSVFAEDVVSVEDENGRLVAKEGVYEISNSIFDGQGLIDVGAMGQYAGKGMVLLRNVFFKCCCFNTNLQQFFRERGITEVSQLNGQTRAKTIDEIKLVTTPSSIKYLKFGSFDAWLDHVEPNFGVVKHEKETHYMGGEMVQAHYQLLNTLQMSREEVAELLAPTFDYLEKVRSDNAVLRYHVHCDVREDDDYIRTCRTKNDIIYAMMGITDEFVRTKLYADFRAETIRAFIKNLKRGHVLISGNYSTLFGNPMEMLLHTVGEFDGTPFLGYGDKVHSKRFAYGTQVVASRSPHISMSNVWVANNVESEDIDRYFNLSKEIVCVNSIGENMQQRLSGCDFDSDTVMMTDNPVLLRSANRNKGKFKVAVSNVSGVKAKRKYTWQDKADLDVKTSNNLIGEIVNLSQELNTMIWDILNSGGSMEEIHNIYLDVCLLNIASGIEIDKAKKEFDISTARELSVLRKKYEREKEDGKRIKPFFFAHKDRLKGYYNVDRNAYTKHKTAMDYLQEEVNSYTRKRRSMNHDYITFAELIDPALYRATRVNTEHANAIIETVAQYKHRKAQIYSSSRYTDEEKFELSAQERQMCVEAIGRMRFSKSTLIDTLRTLESEDPTMFRYVFYTLFGFPNDDFYGILKSSRQKIYKIEPDPNGEISLFSVKFTKKCLTRDIEM